MVGRAGVAILDCPEGKQGSDKRRSCTLGQSPCAVCADALCAWLRLPAPLEVMGGASPTSPGEPWGLFLERNGPYKGVLPVMRAFSSEPLRMSNGPVFPCPNSVDRCSKPEEMTLQGETESKPVGSRTDTVARGVQCLIKFIQKLGLDL